jgi:hypothetical protein
LSRTGENDSFCQAGTQKRRAQDNAGLVEKVATILVYAADEETSVQMTAPGPSRNNAYIILR